MNVRETAETNAAARIAATVIRSFRNMIRQGRAAQIDIADVRDAIAEPMRKELIKARISEAAECERTDRVKILKELL